MGCRSRCAATPCHARRVDVGETWGIYAVASDADFVVSCGCGARRVVLFYATLHYTMVCCAVLRDAQGDRAV
jgi:hypothetical protein